MTLPRVLQIERAVALLWLLAVAIAESDAGVAFPLWMALLVAMLGLIAWWLLRVVWGVASAKPRRPRSLALIPFVVVAALLIATTDVMLMLRVRLSARVLVASAPALAASPPVRFSRTTRVGLFRVEEFDQYGRELRFLTASCGLVDACGVVFSPDGRPPNRGEDSFTHLYGPWWHWYQSW